MAKKSSPLRTILVVFILVLIIGLIIGLVIFVKKESRVPDNPPGTVGNTGGNINNGGMFCQDGDTVYFSNPLDNYSIYSMKKDCSDYKVILRMPAKYLNSAGDYLYYNQFDSGVDLVYGFTGETHGIYRYKKGSHDETKGFDRTAAGQTVLVGNYVYYQHYDNETGMTLHRCSTNGDDKGLILDKIVNLSCVINGNIYFPDQDNAFLLNVLETDSLRSALFLNERMYNPVYSNEYIYYIGIGNNYPLCRFSINTREVEQLTDDRVDAFNILGDIIFYQRNDPESPALIRMNSNGTNPSIIAMGNYENINMTDTYTFFNTFGEPTDLFRVSTTGDPRPESFIPPVIPRKK